MVNAWNGKVTTMVINHGLAACSDRRPMTKDVGRHEHSPSFPATLFHLFCLLRLVSSLTWNPQTNTATSVAHCTDFTLTSNSVLSETRLPSPPPPTLFTTAAIYCVRASATPPTSMFTSYVSFRISLRLSDTEFTPPPLLPLQQFRKLSGHTRCTSKEPF